MEMHIRQKLSHFWHYVVIVKLFCKKSFTPAGYLAWEVMWENFHPGYQDLGCKDQDLSNRASPACQMNTMNIFYEEKEWQSEINLRNQASLVDCAHMKRPLVGNTLTIKQKVLFCCLVC